VRSDEREDIEAELRDAKWYRAIAVALCLTALPAGLEARRATRVHCTIRRMPTDEATIPSPRAARALALGHREWVADLFFIAGLAYFGESLQQRSQQRFLQPYARVTEDIDPGFRRPYVWGSTVSVYTHRMITRRSVELSNEHLLRGLEQFPNDGEMLYALGFNYAFEMLPFVAEGPERRATKRRGALYLQRAAAVGFGPAWLPLTAARMLEDSGDESTAVDLLRDSLLRTEDPTIRARLEQRIRDLTGGGESDPGLAQVRSVERERRESFPYVSPALYLFVGPPAVR
jgi:hypothetical protein